MSHPLCMLIGTTDHCISYPKGGFPSLSHNEACDLAAKMMS